MVKNIRDTTRARLIVLGLAINIARYECNCESSIFRLNVWIVSGPSKNENSETYR